MSAEVSVEGSFRPRPVKDRAPCFQFRHAIRGLFSVSSAMRQLFTYCPPRIVSAKCTFQLSRSSTLARAAAIPPSAITVWALPSRDLHITTA